MAVLLEEEHPPVVVERHDTDSTQVTYVDALERRAVGRLHRVQCQRQERVPVLLRRRTHGPALGPVGQSLPGIEQVAGQPRMGRAIGHPRTCTSGTTYSSTGNRNSRCRSIAAVTSPANNGCARVGRDNSSGCACVATKKGCTSAGSSMNSTSEPSGEVPEMTSPAVSSLSR